MTVIDLGQATISYGQLEFLLNFFLRGFFVKHALKIQASALICRCLKTRDCRKNVLTSSYLWTNKSLKRKGKPNIKLQRKINHEAVDVRWLDDLIELALGWAGQVDAEHPRRLM